MFYESEFWKGITVKNCRFRNFSLWTNSKFSSFLTDSSTWKRELTIALSLTVFRKTYSAVLFQSNLHGPKFQVRQVILFVFNCRHLILFFLPSWLLPLKSQSTVSYLLKGILHKTVRFQKIFLNSSRLSSTQKKPCRFLATFIFIFLQVCPMNFLYYGLYRPDLSTCRKSFDNKILGFSSGSELWWVAKIKNCSMY